MEEVGPDTFSGPSLEAIVERLPRAIDARRIFPSAARHQHMHDAADDTAIIDPGLASRISREVRFEPSELLLRQPKISVVQIRSPSGNLESHHLGAVNPFYGSRP